MIAQNQLAHSGNIRSYYQFGSEVINPKISLRMAELGDIQGFYGCIYLVGKSESTITV